MLRQAAARYGEMTLIGSGFIGLEIAAGLSGRGVAVTVFARTHCRWTPVLGPRWPTHSGICTLARGVRLRSRSRGGVGHGQPGAYEVRAYRTNRAPDPVRDVGHRRRPAVDWLVGSGIHAHDGLVTDAAGRTNVPGVWAAGDVASFDHPLLDSAYGWSTGRTRSSRAATSA